MSVLSKVYKPSRENLEICARLLQNEQLVAVPTETVYGLAGNALSEASVRKIFDVKGRPLIDPLIAHFIDLENARDHVQINDLAVELAKHFWPGPLTMILPKKDTISDLVTAGLPSVGIRSPKHPVLRELLKQLDFPLAAPSANPFCYISPTRAEHVLRTLGHKIPAILDGGPCQFGIESTIVDLRRIDAPRILRQGPISLDQISKVLEMEIGENQLNDDTKNQVAPGMLRKHYSPRTPLSIIEQNEFSPELCIGAETAWILNARPRNLSGRNNIFWLSEKGDLLEQTSNLYHLMQTVDNLGFERIKIEKAPEIGIGKSLNDRILRASATAN